MLREAPRAAGCVRPGVRRGRTAWAVCARHVRAVCAAACIKSGTVLPVADAEVAGYGHLQGSATWFYGVNTHMNGVNTHMNTNEAPLVPYRRTRASRGQPTASQQRSSYV